MRIGPVDGSGIERSPFTTVVGTGSASAARMRVRSVVALFGVAVGRFPERRDAIEVVAETGWHRVNETAATEVVIPRVGRCTAQVDGGRCRSRSRSWSRSRRRTGSRARGGTGRRLCRRLCGGSRSRLDGEARDRCDSDRGNTRHGRRSCSLDSTRGCRTGAAPDDHHCRRRPDDQEPPHALFPFSGGAPPHGTTRRYRKLAVTLADLTCHRQATSPNSIRRQLERLLSAPTSCRGRSCHACHRQSTSRGLS